MIDTTHAFTVTEKSAVSSTLPCANVNRTPPSLKDKVNTKAITDSSTDNESAKCRTTITDSQPKLTTLDPRRLSPGSAPDIKYGTCSPAVPIFLNTPQVRNPPAWPPQPAFPACDATAEHYTARNISGDAAWPPGRPPSSGPTQDPISQKLQEKTLPLVNFVEADPAAMATLAQQAWLCPRPQVQSSELAEALSGLLSLAKPAPPAQPACAAPLPCPPREHPPVLISFDAAQFADPDSWVTQCVHEHNPATDIVLPRSLSKRAANKQGGLSQPAAALAPPTDTSRNARLRDQVRGAPASPVVVPAAEAARGHQTAKPTSDDSVKVHDSNQGRKPGRLAPSDADIFINRRPLLDEDSSASVSRCAGLPVPIDPHLREWYQEAVALTDSETVLDPYGEWQIWVESVQKEDPNEERTREIHTISGAQLLSAGTLLEETDFYRWMVTIGIDIDPQGRVRSRVMGGIQSSPTMATELYEIGLTGHRWYAEIVRIVQDTERTESDQMTEDEKVRVLLEHTETAMEAVGRHAVVCNREDMEDVQTRLLSILRTEIYSEERSGPEALWGPKEFPALAPPERGVGNKARGEAGPAAVGSPCRVWPSTQVRPDIHATGGSNQLRAPTMLRDWGDKVSPTSAPRPSGAPCPRADWTLRDYMRGVGDSGERSVTKTAETDPLAWRKEAMTAAKGHAGRNRHRPQLTRSDAVQKEQQQRPTPRQKAEPHAPPRPSRLQMTPAASDGSQETEPRPRRVSAPAPVPLPTHNYYGALDTGEAPGLSGADTQNRRPTPTRGSPAPAASAQRQRRNASRKRSAKQQPTAIPKGGMCSAAIPVSSALFTRSVSAGAGHAPRGPPEDMGTWCFPSESEGGVASAFSTLGTDGPLASRVPEWDPTVTALWSGERAGPLTARIEHCLEHGTVETGSREPAAGRNVLYKGSGRPLRATQPILSLASSTGGGGGLPARRGRKGKEWTRARMAVETRGPPDDPGPGSHLATDVHGGIDTYKHCRQ